MPARDLHAFDGHRICLFRNLALTNSILRWVSGSALTLAVVCLSGCSEPQPKTVSELDSETPSLVEGGSTGDASEIASRDETPPPAPELELGSLNDQGQIVLRAAGDDPSSVGDAVREPSDAGDRQPVDAVADGASTDSAPVEAQTVSLDGQAGRVQAEQVPARSGVLATDAEKNQKIAEGWPQPQAVIYVSGQQHGYIEPCGCTGLENQKGGLVRRDTLLTQLRERGWNLVPVDVGNQVRREVSRQPAIKFATTVDAFETMGYQAATLGVDDLRLSSIELIQKAGSDELNPGIFVSANVTVIAPDFFPTHRIVESGGRRIGITGVLGAEYKDSLQISDVEISEPGESLAPVIKELRSENCDYIVLLAHASLDESKAIAQAVPGIDLVVTAGGYGEPTLHPEKIEGSDAIMVQVGTKGMYGGIVGLFDDEQQPVRYQKIAISSQFEDSPRMLEAFAEYQQQLKSLGLEKLGVTPLSHPTGRKFVGSEVCGDCHTSAFETWEGTPHVHATESIIAPNNDRGGIARHHDPECISCHVTGWNDQKYYPYITGFLSPEETPHMMGSGCENCHGPGKDHVDAEYGDVEVDNDTLLKLRAQMVLKLEHAEQHCLTCHDLDNSPNFNFEDYWEQVKHYGKD